MCFWLNIKNHNQPKLVNMSKINLIGRVEEIVILEQTLVSPVSEFVAVYGRRRVGKTFMVREFYDKTICFEMVGMFKASLQEQLSNFAQALRKSTGFGILPQKPASWQEAFFQIENYLESPMVKENPGKRVVFFDELPWLNTPRSGFLKALEHFWNSFGSRQKNLVLVVCGSAASWMIQHIVRSRGGLHNRLTRQIRLLPFSLSETEKYLSSKNVILTRFQIVELYMAFGGIPYYLSQVEPGLSAAQIIDKSCFTMNGLLRQEYEKLYASLFEDSQYHTKIVELLAKKSKGISRNELLSATNISSGGTATRILEELEESGFIESYIPYGKMAKDALFRLSDEFTQFYFDWIKPLGKKSPGNGYWLTRQNQPVKNSWTGFTFENICIKHVQKIKNTLGISGIETNHAAWRFQPPTDSPLPGAQIDLLIDRRDAAINLCEIKFSNSEFVIDAKYAAELRQKKEVFRQVTKTRKNVFITLITSFGLVQNAYSRELVASSLTLDDLF